PPATTPVAAPAPTETGRDPSWPVPETVAADLAQGRTDVLFASLLALLRSRATAEYRYTDLGNDLRRHFGFQLKEHPEVAAKFGDLIEAFGRRYTIETRQQGTQYYVRLLPDSPIEETAGEEAAPEPQLIPQDEEPDPRPTDPTAISDAALAAALREVIAYEDERAGTPINPSEWRKRLRLAIERAGGPHLDPKAMSRLIRTRLIPERIVEPTGEPPDQGRRLRPYRVRRDHPSVIALSEQNDSRSQRNGGGND
ncbi:MAG TPA: OST-HTH/LOTUS domain-containing protein, partial [Thermomicrobiales bacterium]|nr:OST-HTH/LOTUS domain-containing protein [Thermomicrobiales bacterium]